MFKIVKGRFRTRWHAKTASVAISEMAALDFSSGKLTNATSGSTKIAGFAGRPVASSDSDYASATKMPYHVPLSTCELEADVGTGTPSASNDGTYIDLADANNVDVSASTTDIFLQKGVISSSKVLVSVNPEKLY